MPAKIIDGSALAKRLLAKARQAVQGLGSQPTLAVILAGSNDASKLYVKKKEEACAQLGIGFRLFAFPKSASGQEIIRKVTELNNDRDVSGILVQLPLPKGIDSNSVLRAIDPLKDVDGFAPMNEGLLALGIEEMVSCTPLGILNILESERINLEGKNCCIINHSVVVGRPLAQLLLNRNATVTVCHKFTKNLSGFTKKADVLITAAGVPGLIKGKMVKKGAFVIDAGIAKKDGKILGDVDFNSVKKVAGYLTPVPGGVGPMTVACLMYNIVKAAQLQRR